MNPRERPGQALQNHQELRLFVSGFSRQTTTAQVAAYFSLYGQARVEKYDSYFKRDQARARFKGGEGYFILCEMHPITYKRILEARPHRILNRSLEVCPLKTGLDLIMYNYQKNQRRVLIKKVPATIEELQFLTAIRSQFGPVEQFFGYKSDNLARQSRYVSQKRFITYSVIFQEKASAVKAIRQGFISLRTIDGEFIANVEKFKRSVVSEQNPLESAIQPIWPFKSTDGLQNLTSGSSRGRKAPTFESQGLIDTSEQANPVRGQVRSPTSFEDVRDGEISSGISHARPANSKEALASWYVSAGSEHWNKPNSKGYQSPLSTLESRSNLMFRIAYCSKTL